MVHVRALRHALSGAAASTVGHAAAMTAALRFFAILVAVALLTFPPFPIFGITVRAPRFRTGTSADFIGFAGTMVAIYGGVFLGLALYWAGVGRDWRRMRPVGVFRAGVQGTLGIGVVFIVGAGLYGLTTQGSFEKGIGTLWGLILIFATVFGAIVSGGAALLLHAVRSTSR